MNYIKKKLRTIQDLRKNQDLLTKQQKIGLKYFEDLQEKMPREEVKQIVDIIRHKTDEIAGKVVYNICITGSYRRGRQMCGDVDIVMARKDDEPSEMFPLTLIKSLENVLLVDHLQLPTPKHGNQTYVGIGRLPGGKFRKIDIKHYPREMFGLGVLYFTGSGNFYRDMRGLAKKMGYSLSDEGFFPVIRNERNEVLWTGQSIPCSSEEDVFKLLGLEWKDPTERDIGNMPPDKLG